MPNANNHMYKHSMLHKCGKLLEYSHTLTWLGRQHGSRLLNQKIMYKDKLKVYNKGVLLRNVDECIELWAESIVNAMNEHVYV